MKYKTLFRLMVKALGIYFIVYGGCYFIVQASAFAVTLLLEGTLDMPFAFSLTYALSTLALALAGLYLFFRGEWIVNRAIPSNRPYCPECAYDLTGAPENRCPECGTPFRPEDVRPPVDPNDGPDAGL